MQVIDANGRFVKNAWCRADNGTPLKGDHIIITMQRLVDQAHELHDVTFLGVDVPNDVDMALLTHSIKPFSIALISVQFPSFADGRGFSVATALRRAQFGGELRAQGHIIADQFDIAKRCGFDSVEISLAQAARQPEPEWRRNSISITYQLGDKGNVLTQRHIHA